MRREDSETIAGVLVESDLAGVMTHGLALLSFYVPALREGDINPRPEITRMRDEGATALLDADGAPGQLAGVAAARLAIERAGEHGVSFIGVRNSRHWGAAAHYVELVLPHRMIGIAISLGAGNCMAPWGGLDYLVGNNPIAIAVPAGRHFPPVLDMALSTTSRSKVLQAVKRGTDIPANWAFDRDGRPTSDAAEAAEGFLAPIGGYKGYGLSVMLSLLAGALPGASIGLQLRPFFDLPGNSGHLVGAIDVARFRDPDEFEAAVDGFLDELRDCRRMAGVDRILVPGEAHHETAQHRRVHGVPVDDVYLADLDRLSQELGLARIARRS